jgi:hypothetical protein
MAKTHHRRRHRRANRTRRGGVKSNPNPNPKPVLDEEASQILAGLFAKVDAAASQAKATPQKISKPPSQSAIEKKKKKEFNKVLAGRAKQSSKSSYKHKSGVVDPFLSQQFLHNGQ